ncbi:MAG: MBL fold metallo-hydrolase [Clostridiales bacterium]|nr:MBL fold metallo-hydrolase [Clostridiales bacterium]
MVLNLEGKRTRFFDLYQAGAPEVTAGYLIRAPQVALLDPGGSRSLPYILEAMEEEGIRRERVAYILLTHIHVDHAGGTGTLLKELPNAKVVVHPRGAPHLVDPTRLAAGTAAIHGPQWEEVFGPMDPVPEDRILLAEDGLRLDLGEGHVVEVLDTPGHAFHHVVYYDPKDSLLFSGDALGVTYPSMEGPRGQYVIPSTAPNQFDPRLTVESARKLSRLSVDGVAVSHFGPYALDLSALPHHLERVIGLMLEATEAFARERNLGDDPSLETVAELAGILWERVRQDMEAQGLRPRDGGVPYDFLVNAAGLLYYWRYRQTHPA